MGELLALIGRNTLEIYLLHYFLLFRMPQTIIEYTHSMYGGIANHCAGLVELLIYGPICLIIAMTCIGIKTLIMQVPIVSGILFGK